MLVFFLALVCRCSLWGLHSAKAPWASYLAGAGQLPTTDCMSGVRLSRVLDLSLALGL